MQNIATTIFIFLMLCCIGCKAQPVAQADAQQVEIGAQITVQPAHRLPCLACVYTERIRRTDSAAVQYIKKHAADALYVEHEYGLPASVVLAVAIYESGCGGSAIATAANNHFGLRYYAAAGEPQYIDSPQPHKCAKNRLWRKFATVRECYDYFARTRALAPFTGAPYDILTPDKFAATGWGGRGAKKQKRYAQALKNIIHRYNLDKI